MDLCPFIGDYAREISHLLDKTTSDERDLFERGRRLGLIEAASLLISQADAFGIDRKKLGLNILSERGDLI